MCVPMKTGAKSVSCLCWLFNARRFAHLTACIACAASAVSAKAAGVRDALVAAGVPCNVVTGAGTGTFEIESMLGVFTGMIQYADF